MSDARLEQNTAHVQAFDDLMFNQCRPAEAIQRNAGDTYIQHNPHVGDGKYAFVDSFDRMAREYPGKRMEFVRAFAVGEYVILHCRRTWPGDQTYAGIDIFRLDVAGKVVEHWDELQLVPERSAKPQRDGLTAAIRGPSAEPVPYAGSGPPGRDRVALPGLR